MFDLKNNVNPKKVDSFFEFVDPFLQQYGFQNISNDPRLYIVNNTINNNEMLNMIKKIKTLKGYSEIIQFVHTGNLKKS